MKRLLFLMTFLVVSAGTAYSFQRSPGAVKTVSTSDGATIRKFEESQNTYLVKTMPGEWVVTALQSKKNLAGRTDPVLGDLEYCKYVVTTHNTRTGQKEELRLNDAKNKFDALKDEFRQAENAGSVVESD